MNEIERLRAAAFPTERNISDGSSALDTCVCLERLDWRLQKAGRRKEGLSLETEQYEGDDIKP